MRLSVKNRKTSLYETRDGKKPFDEWLWRLKDLKAKARIIHRVDRAAIGNFGKYRDLRSGVMELKEDFGPGYRFYFGLTDYLWRKNS